MRIIAIYIAVLLSVAANAQTEYYDALLIQANEQYAASNYDSAIVLYEEIIQAEYESFDLFYNAGNAYYKRGDISSSILYYEKANKLNPGEKDLAFNLAIANEQTVDKIEKLPEFFLSLWWTSFSYSYSMDTWAVISILMVLLCSLSVFLFIKTSESSAKRTYFYGSLFCILLAALSFSAAQSSYNWKNKKSTAIIFSPTITVQSAPAANSSDLFVVHEGTKVRILKAEGAWINISLEDGNEGWIKKEAVLVI